ncbi:MAG: PRC-barrel domain-containing protein [Actinomycetota bacterium]|nr:PRC-barrel domain-containing protein [Actinomycetota bacterium]
MVVVALSDRSERFEPGALLYADQRAVVVASSRRHRGGLLVRFSDVADRTAAERLRGARLEADQLPDDEERDAYLVSELVGMPVVSEDGRELGVVEALVELPPSAEYDLLEVVPPQGPPWLLPTAEDYVGVEEDETGLERLVVVAPPEGLVPDEILEPRREGALPGRSGPSAPDRRH